MLSHNKNQNNRKSFVVFITSERLSYYKHNSHFVFIIFLSRRRQSQTSQANTTINSSTSNLSNQQQQLNSSSSAIYHVPTTTEPPPYSSTFLPPYAESKPPDYDTLSLSIQQYIQPAIDSAQENSSYCQTPVEVADSVLPVCALRQELPQ